MVGVNSEWLGLIGNVSPIHLKSSLNNITTILLQCSQSDLVLHGSNFQAVCPIQFV